MTRLSRGVLAGPLVFGAMIFLFFSVALAFDSKGLSGDWYILPFIFILASIVVAYLNVFIFGIPYYRLLKKHGRDNLFYILTGALIMGGVCFYFFSLLLKVEPSQYGEGTVMFAISGVLVAFLVWWIGVRERKSQD